MIASLNPATLKQYNKPLKLWTDFCTLKEICPFNANLAEIFEFLSNCFENINHYGTLNTYRSALSLIMSKDIGNDPYVK